MEGGFLSLAKETKAKYKTHRDKKTTKRQKGKYFWTSPKRQKYRKIKDTKTKHKKAKKRDKNRKRQKHKYKKT